MNSAGTPRLFIREGDRIQPADVEDEEVARRYPAFPDKGAILGGYRITILTRNLTVHAGESVRVVHVCEAVIPGTRLYVMGPKPVYDEYVGDILATTALPAGEDPLVPSSYDGRVATGPAIDYNYEITQYRFDEPGIYLIQWRLGMLASNTLGIQIASR